MFCRAASGKTPTAKPSEEPSDVAHDSQTLRNNSEHRKRRNASNDRSEPDDNCGTRIRRNIGSRDRERIKDDLLNRAPGNNSADDMAEFVDGHHCKPAQRHERNGK